MALVCLLLAITYAELLAIQLFLFLPSLLSMWGGTIGVLIFTPLNPMESLCSCFQP
jgi:hypothetical protein